jgi:hypothetical protein
MGCNIKLQHSLVTMPSSRSSRSSRNTVRTVDDVLEKLSIYEETHGDSSRTEAIQFVNNLCPDPKLRREARDALENPLIYFAPICSDSAGLLKAMAQYGVILGGNQATAFFYPIVRITSAPWDFYCDKNKCDADGFVARFKQITMFDIIEDIKADDGKRVVYFRGNVNGSNDPITVRIYISYEDVIASVLDLTMSYQHSFVATYGAVCFWPKLNEAKQYRTFTGNGGQGAYPRGKTICTAQMTKLTQVVPRSHGSAPSIYSGADKRTEVVKFKNEVRIPDEIFKHHAAMLFDVVYAVTLKSTRFLGSVGDMK